MQGIALLWTLLQSGHELLGGDPLAKRVIICCPTSLVSNWDSECGKWLKVSFADTAWGLSGMEEHIIQLDMIIAAKGLCSQAF